MAKPSSPNTICTEARKPQGKSTSKRTASVRNPYQIRGKLTKEKMNSVQRLLDYNEEYAEFHRLTAQLVRGERALGRARSARDTEGEAVARVALESSTISWQAKYSFTVTKETHKYDALLRRWNAHGMFHAKEMGLEDCVPATPWLASWTYEHGTAEEILGPAAEYNPDCL